MLPPVPALWGDGWREEWQRRLETQEPWVLTWLRENRDGPYWRHGSVRTDGDGGGYDRIACPVMIVAGWADGYRNNSFRTVEALARRRGSVPPARRPVGARRPDHGVPRARGSTSTWRWSRGGTGGCVAADATPHRDGVDVFVRTSTRPEPDLDQHEGRWTRDTWPSPAGSTVTRALAGPRVLSVDPDVGTAAWIDCAGHLPWGLSGDQREDDARSLVWDWAGPTRSVLLGQPRVRLRISADAPAASLSVKLCDVFPDGTSALITRGSLDLAFRDGVHAPAVPSPLVPGAGVRRRGGARRLRLRSSTPASGSGSPWPVPTGRTRSLPRRPSR